MIKILNRENLSKNAGLALLIFSQISFLAGSLLVNLTTILFIISYFFFSSLKENFSFIKKYKYFFVFILIFFIFNVISSDIKSYSANKALLYLRFFVFSLSIIFFLKLIKNKINIYLNFLVILLVFLIIDSLLQFYLGKDIFGYKYNSDYLRLSGPFGDEWIIGYYIFNLGFLTLSYLNFYKTIKPLNNIIMMTVISALVLYSGERTSYFGIYILLFLIFLFTNKKKIILISIFTIIISSILLIKQPFGDERGGYLSMKYDLNRLAPAFKWFDRGNVHQKLKDNDSNSNKGIISTVDSNVKLNDFSKFLNNFEQSKWFAHFSAGISIAEQNLLLGSGFRTFRHVCHDYEKEKKIEIKVRCSTHPHNFHIEILSENGLLGYLIFITFILYIFYLYLTNKLYKNFGCTILFSLIITFIFPFKTTGSFFTTNTSYIFWYIVAHFFYLNYEIEKINSKKTF